MKLLLSVLFFLVLKMSIFSYESYDSEFNTCIELVSKMNKAFVDSISKERNLTWIGSSGHLRCSIIGLEFEHKGILSKDEMRKLLVSLTNEFLNKINFNDSIRPYMDEYPFTSKNVIITVYVEDPKNREIFFPDIDVASADEGCIHYCYLLDGKEVKCKEIIESFEEAKAIVESQK